VLAEGDLERLAVLCPVIRGPLWLPHCVEWVKDAQGELQVVQSRHLRRPIIPGGP